ncbi:EEP domain-containing protein [Roseomonas terrae]|uniref:EEP domain-containing protein n=1 Tax=Neoroseomonas terrae TaxID=424799 RepID=A0ABS5EF86_9PROT|nr:endonuclease/exonuclease/phosphatase family protein [Neoroseomonas terrae]MBR0649678.1 EEP domain-containing protein [Neoroseomonas terrae]
MSRRQVSVNRVRSAPDQLLRRLFRVSRPQPEAPPPPGALRIATYNVHKCVGTDNRFDPDRIATVIRELDADVLALQEADRRFGRREGLLDTTALERDTGLRMVPLAMAAGGHGWHGNALLVRNGRMVEAYRLRLPGGEPRGATLVELEMAGGARLRVMTAHLGLLRRHRAQQVAALLERLAEADDTPTLLLGDLNEWRPGQRSSLRALERDFGPVDRGPPTFPSRLPILSLDRILCRPTGLLSGLAAHETPLARIASDHLPLTARLDLATARPEAMAEAA